VRISVAIKKSAEVEVLLTHMLERFMSLRADKFEILRKKPAFPEYDFSFLVSDDHLQRFKKEEIINLRNEVECDQPLQTCRLFLHKRAGQQQDRLKD
jgi:hypothetical protein